MVPVCLGWWGFHICRLVNSYNSCPFSEELITWLRMQRNDFLCYLDLDIVDLCLKAVCFSEVLWESKRWLHFGLRSLTSNFTYIVFNMTGQPLFQKWSLPTVLWWICRHTDMCQYIMWTTRNAQTGCKELCLHAFSCFSYCYLCIITFNSALSVFVALSSWLVPCFMVLNSGWMSCDMITLLVV